MSKINTNEPENQQRITRVVQIALTVNQQNAVAFVPSVMLLQLPPIEQIDVIELRLIIDRKQTTLVY